MRKGPIKKKGNRKITQFNKRNKRKGTSSVEAWGWRKKKRNLREKGKWRM